MLQLLNNIKEVIFFKNNNIKNKHLSKIIDITILKQFKQYLYYMQATSIDQNPTVVFLNAKHVTAKIKVHFTKN